ncbi:MAG: hypothetical protein U1C46_05970 [Bacteroidales bacterium]|nr:hypothetical protein [Bacteroidales bacterium]MDZ4204346.1 hypothetical protein [Bacteroidales bacterium]
MESKLQELTGRIYSEGIEKANKEAAAILGNARLEATAIVAKANKDAQKILESAKTESENLRKNVSNEVQMSARQAISAIRQKITNLLTAQLVANPVKEALGDKEFMKRIIETMIKNWNPQSSQGIDLDLVLPQADEQQLGKYFSAKSHELLKANLEVQFDEHMSGGFKIGPSDKSYILSFTENDFENFFKEYLRPRTTELLYGSK